MNIKTNEVKECLLHSRIEKEHSEFRAMELSKSRSAIYEDCTLIQFNECVYEYLAFADDISEEQKDALINCDGNIFETLYRIYLKNEFLKAETWEEISSIIAVLVDEQKSQSLYH